MSLCECNVEWIYVVLAFASMGFVGRMHRYPITNLNDALERGYSVVAIALKDDTPFGCCRCSCRTRVRLGKHASNSKHGLSTDAASVYDDDTDCRDVSKQKPVV